MCVCICESLRVNRTEEKEGANGARLNKRKATSLFYRHVVVNKQRPGKGMWMTGLVAG